MVVWDIKHLSGKQNLLSKGGCCFILAALPFSIGELIMHS